MAEVKRERLEAEFAQVLGTVTPADLAVLIPHIDRFGLGGDLDLVIRTARPGAKVQRRFLPAHVQAEILKAGLRSAKGIDLVQDAVVGLYAEELGDDVADPSREQLSAATKAVLKLVSPSLVQLTLLGVVAREEVAAPHAVAVLQEQFACDLTR